MGNKGSKKNDLAQGGKEAFVESMGAGSKKFEKEEDALTKKMNDMTLENNGKKKNSTKYTIKMAKANKNSPAIKERAMEHETQAAELLSATYPSKKWTPEQDAALRIAVEHFGGKNWKAIAEAVPGRTHVQCLQRWKKVLQPGLVKGHWTEEEDKQLIALVTKPSGLTSWVSIAEHIPGRTAKQCRERWSLNLDPEIKRGPWSEDEDKLLLELHERLGNKWAEISSYMNGRTENAVKTRYKSLARAQQKLWTPDEDRIIIESKRAANNRWVSIANRLPGRSKNAVRLRWKFLVSQNPELETPLSKEEREQLQAKVAEQQRLQAEKEKVKQMEEAAAAAAAQIKVEQQKQLQQQQQQHVKLEHGASVGSLIDALDWNAPEMQHQQHPPQQQQFPTFPVPMAPPQQPYQYQQQQHHHHQQQQQPATYMNPQTQYIEVPYVPPLVHNSNMDMVSQQQPHHPEEYISNGQEISFPPTPNSAGGLGEMLDIKFEDIQFDGSPQQDSVLKNANMVFNNNNNDPGVIQYQTMDPSKNTFNRVPSRREASDSISRLLDDDFNPLDQQKHGSLANTFDSQDNAMLMDALGGSTQNLQQANDDLRVV